MSILDQKHKLSKADHSLEEARNGNMDSWGIPVSVDGLRIIFEIKLTSTLGIYCVMILNRPRSFDGACVFDGISEYNIENYESVSDALERIKAGMFKDIPEMVSRYSLTRHQAEVYTLIKNGMTNANVCFMLGMFDSNVLKTYRAAEENIRRKTVPADREAEPKKADVKADDTAAKLQDVMNDIFKRRG